MLQHYFYSTVAVLLGCVLLVACVMLFFRRTRAIAALLVVVGFVGIIVLDHAKTQALEQLAIRQGFRSSAEMEEARALGLDAANFHQRQADAERARREREQAVARQIAEAQEVAEAARREREQAIAQRIAEASVARTRLEAEARAVAEAAKTKALALLVGGCKAGMAMLMGRPTDTMNARSVSENLVHVSYRRNDGTTWRYACQIAVDEEQTVTIEWAAVSANGSPGRWRNDYQYDERITVRQEGQQLVVILRNADGSGETRRFDLRRLNR